MARRKLETVAVAVADTDNLLFDTVSERGIGLSDMLSREQPWWDGSLPAQGLLSGFLKQACRRNILLTVKGDSLND